MLGGGCPGRLRLVGYMLQPGRAVAVGGALVHGDMGHVGRSRALPVFLTGRDVDHLPRAGHDDGALTGTMGFRWLQNFEVSAMTSNAVTSRPPGNSRS